MEKLIYVLPSTSPTLRREAPTLAQHTRGLALLTPSEPHPARATAILIVWMACLDRRMAFEQALRTLAPGADGYLVTESVIRGARGPVAQHSEATLVLLRYAPQLGQAELRERLACSLSPSLDQRASSERIMRDCVVRPLETSAGPLRALFTFVHGARPESPNTLQAFDTICRPEQREVLVVHRRIVRPRRLDPTMREHDPL